MAFPTGNFAHELPGRLRVTFQGQYAVNDDDAGADAGDDGNESPSSVRTDVSTATPSISTPALSSESAARRRRCSDSVFEAAVAASRYARPAAAPRPA